MGGLTLPILSATHFVRIFDLTPPAPGNWDYVEGDIEDRGALKEAFADIDAMVYMAMNTKEDWGGERSVLSAFDVNVKYLYMALWAAGEAGVRHAVYASSMSVYRSIDGRYPDESSPPDARDFYGLTKRLGEEVCRTAVGEWKLTANALRLCFPVPDGELPPKDETFMDRIATAASDVSRAIDAALRYRHGFEAFNISGDRDERAMSHAKARRLLGWSPIGGLSPNR